MNFSKKTWGWLCTILAMMLIVVIGVAFDKSSKSPPVPKEVYSVTSYTYDVKMDEKWEKVREPVVCSFDVVVSKTKIQFYKSGEQDVGFYIDQADSWEIQDSGIYRRYFKVHDACFKDVYIWFFKRKDCKYIIEIWLPDTRIYYLGVLKE